MFYIQKSAELCPQNEFPYIVFLPLKQPLLSSTTQPIGLHNGRISPEATTVSLYNVDEFWSSKK